MHRVLYLGDPGHDFPLQLGEQIRRSGLRFGRGAAEGAAYVARFYPGAHRALLDGAAVVGDPVDQLVSGGAEFFWGHFFCSA